VSQTALTPVANVVDTNYTVVAKMAKSYLPGITVMGGIHRRLRGSSG
jgi:amidase